MLRLPLTRRQCLAMALPSVWTACSWKPAFHGYAFVANEAGKSLAAVDLSNFSLARSIPLDHAPAFVLSDATHTAVYAASTEGGLYQVDVKNLSVHRRTHAGASIAALRQAGDSLWALSREKASLIRIPVSSLTPAGRIPLPAAPDDFDLNQDATLAAVVSQQANALWTVDLRAGKILRTTELSGDPRIVRFRKDGGSILAGNRGPRIVNVVDTATGKPIVKLSLPLDPVNFCTKADGGEIYVSGPGMDAVAIVSPYRTEVSETILAGNAPAGMAEVSNWGYLLVTNPATGDLTILDMTVRKLVASMHVGEGPREVVVTPDNQYALVLNQESGTLAVIRLGVLRERRHRADPPPLLTSVAVGDKPTRAAVVMIG